MANLQRSFIVSDPNYKQKISDSFARQQFMDFIGAQLVAVEPGYCEIHLPYHQNLSQQHAYFHGGVIGTIADTCGGYAAYTLMPVNASILTVEYKLNFTAPGNGRLLICRGQVIKPGRTLTISKADVFVVKESVEKLCATVLITLMSMAGKADKPTTT